MQLKVLLCIEFLVGNCGLLEFVEHLFRYLIFLFKLKLKLIGLSLYVNLSFPHISFNILYVLEILFWFYVLWRVFFLDSLFGVLYACCTYIGASFFRLQNFPDMILLKVYIFSIWPSIFSPSSISIFHRLSLLNISKIYWMICAWIV